MAASLNSQQHATYTVLVTGANSGLGLATCCRLIDEFLQTRPSSQSIHLLFSTRDVKKRAQTLQAINGHIGNTLKEVQGTADRLHGPRVTIQGVLVDLSRLLTVKALAKQLQGEFEHIDAVVCNAGIGGWSGLHWGHAIYSLLFDFMQATTFPTFQSCYVGAVTKRQLPATANKVEEPPLGEVFAANLFGHYMLVHWIASVLTSESRIVWVSSLSAASKYLSFDDFQRLGTSEAYESSKRATDLMVLTSELPATQQYVSSFLPASPGRSTRSKATTSHPVMYTTHPGVVFTGINGLPWYLSIFILGSFWLARWLGSPWHTITTYKGAVSATWTCLAPDEQLRDLELRLGKGKWGSVVTVQGAEGVKRTEVDGWGFSGVVGPAPSGSVSGKQGRLRGRTKFTAESRVEFEEQGRLVWQELEVLRKAWEERLDTAE
ncbi:hypothetical protein AMS68_004805 [Peltaster fructicola]|uniref:3-keto-steroid reductase n=1 Tax=Peltaster fructicola TaxID=286661 RepID=A0A6H0XXG3_9PEZI|nr:hypothetical protein AMS68_004805 [Peltaster fructicola]